MSCVRSRCLRVLLRCCVSHPQPAWGSAALAELTGKVSLDCSTDRGEPARLGGALDLGPLCLQGMVGGGCALGCSGSLQCPQLPSQFSLLQSPNFQARLHKEEAGPLPDSAHPSFPGCKRVAFRSHCNFIPISHTQEGLAPQHNAGRGKKSKEGPPSLW